MLKVSARGYDFTLPTTAWQKSRATVAAIGLETQVGRNGGSGVVPEAFGRLC